MRWYSITLTNSTTGKLIVPNSLASLKTGASYTSSDNAQVSGNPLIGAQNINLDIPIAQLALPAGNAWVQIEGISIPEIGQANDLNNANIVIKGGFQKGLPLANPAQAGVLVQGTIYQAFGNWIDTEQTVDLLIIPPIGTNDKPINLTLNWQKGQTLASALHQTLSTAYPPPQYTIKINISPNIVASETQPAYHGTLGQLASYCYGVSKQIIKTANYQGVGLAIYGNTVIADDGSSANTVKNIQFQELIGQPTWLNPSTIQFKCPMRADINIFDQVKLPQALVTTAVNTTSPLINANATFKGTYRIVNVRHVGNFRQASADSWVTVFDAVTQPVPV